MFYIDPLYMMMVLPAIVLVGLAQLYVRRTFSRYSDVTTVGGRSGADVARLLLDSHGLADVGIEEVPGELTDHYDPSRRVLALSPAVGRGHSVAAMGVAAHEAGHALQDSTGYSPLRIRHGLVPAANLGGSLAFPLIVVGLFLRMGGLITLGIAIFAAYVLFQLITLPVELNASRRAVAALADTGQIVPGEQGAVRAVLTAAALTYLAAALVAVMQLVYFLVLGGRRD